MHLANKSDSDSRRAQLVSNLTKLHADDARVFVSLLLLFLFAVDAVKLRLRGESHSARVSIRPDGRGNQ